MNLLSRKAVPDAKRDAPANTVKNVECSAICLLMPSRIVPEFANAMSFKTLATFSICGNAFAIPAAVHNAPDSSLADLSAVDSRFVAFI